MDRTGEETITPEGFRKLEHPSIFIAGSGDIIEMREQVEAALNEVLSEMGGRDRYRPFSWDVDVGTDGFSQARSMQKNLPRPSDAECCGLICVIGERIGLPLETDFDLKLIPGVEKWLASDSKFRLAEGYPEDLDERIKVLEEGFYPLTGTSFEVLDALGAGKPVLLILLADEAIKPDGPEIVLNGNCYFYRRTNGLAPVSAEFDQERRLYQEQVRGVHNFFCGLGKVGGLKQHRTRDAGKVRQLVQQFVAEEVLKDDPTNENPYKYLNYFDVNDGDCFFGRDDFVGQAVEDLESRWSSEDEPTVVRIEGPSGCGKSSVLRAGILGDFLQSKRRRRYACVAFRPEDFNDSSGRPMAVIETLLYLIEEKTDLVITLKMLRGVRREGANAPAAAVALLSEILESEGKKLVLGIDQFEEILDVLAHGVHDDMWLPLVAFINLAAKKSQIGIVYTLESSRRDAHEKEDLGPAFEGAGVHVLDDESETFLRNVIAKPFSIRGYPLKKKAIDTLLKNLNDIRDADDRQGRYGVLPLLSLKLSILFDQIRELRLNHSSTEAKVDFDSDEKDAEVLDLGFEDIFEKQAMDAISKAGGTVDDESIDHFLQPFVAVEDDRIQLIAVAETRPYPDEQKLAAAFLEARLLTRVGNARLRLVHEAVIRRWSKARKWFEDRSPYLKMEAWVRVDAIHWDALKRPPLVGPAIEGERINEAAQILQTFLRAWSIDPEAVSGDNRRLRDYCLEIFAHSEGPMTMVPCLPGREGIYSTLAAAYGMVDLLRRYKESDPDSPGKPNPYGNRGTLPLGSAAWAHLDAVAYLLGEGVDPVAKNSFGWPAVSGAIQSGERKIFRRIMEACQEAHPEANLEELLSCPGGWTLLHLSSSADQAEIAQALIEDYDFTPDARGDDKDMPIHVAASNGAGKVFELLQRNPAHLREENKSGYNCLHLAALNGHNQVVDTILSGKAGAELAAKQAGVWTPLRMAVWAGHASCCEKLLGHGSSRMDNDSDLPFLHLILGRGPDETGKSRGLNESQILPTIRVLLAGGADPNGKDSAGRTPLKLAERLPKVRRLLLDDPRLDPFLPIEPNGETAIGTAAGTGYWEAFRSFVDQCPDLTFPDLGGRGNSYWHLLAHKGSPADLVDDGLPELDAVTLEMRNKAGQTPMGVAMLQRNWAFVERLLDAGLVRPNWNAGRNLNWVSLALEQEASEALLKRLIELDPDQLTEPNVMGWTVLHRACALQMTKWVEQLASVRGDISDMWEIEDREGRLPADLLRPEARNSLSVVESDRPWPPPKSWDTDCIWKPVPGSEREELLERLAIDTKEGERVVSSDTDIDETVLSFYPEGVRLIRLKDEKWPQENLQLYYLVTAESVTFLNGTSPGIHDLNSKRIGEAGVLQLSAGTVLDYLRFFCFFVRGVEGPFLVLESVDQKEVPVDLSPGNREKISTFSHPAWFNGRDEEGEAFLLTANIYYNDSFFSADFRVQDTGTIEMFDDFPVLSNLKARIDLPIR